MCWWCCMRVLEKCLPRNDIVRELAPYLQHVHRDETTDDSEEHCSGSIQSRNNPNQPNSIQQIQQVGPNQTQTIRPQLNRNGNSGNMRPHPSGISSTSNGLETPHATPYVTMGDVGLDTLDEEDDRKKKRLMRIQTAPSLSSAKADASRRLHSEDDVMHLQNVASWNSDASDTASHQDPRASAPASAPAGGALSSASSSSMGSTSASTSASTMGRTSTLDRSHQVLTIREESTISNEATCMIDERERRAHLSASGPSHDHPQQHFFGNDAPSSSGSNNTDIEFKSRKILKIHSTGQLPTDKSSMMAGASFAGAAAAARDTNSKSDNSIDFPSHQQQQQQQQALPASPAPLVSGASSSNICTATTSSLTTVSNGSTCAGSGATAGTLQKKNSFPKIKTDLGDVLPVRYEKTVIVQVSVANFREMTSKSKDLMEEAKLLYEHTVLSRLASEYGGQEILSQPRSGLFVIAFHSEFHAAKWCLSLQLSLVYAAWNEKLLRVFPELMEVYAPASLVGKNKKNVLLFRGFRVKMVIHTANSLVPTEQSLAQAVKWTNTISECAHGGQIVLSESVWDRLKEQLVQLGNPVVEDLGSHFVLEEEVQLMQLLPRDLEHRRFNKLVSKQQLTLGMREAPSALGQVTMVFTFIEGARPLVRCHAEELASRIKQLCTQARKLLRKHNGYECQELQGDFMLAFFHPSDAVLWCGEFQLFIDEMFRCWKDEQALKFSMSMGIETGVPASVSPHKTSGRADYFGNIVNQTARIAKAAHGGQILIGGDAWRAMKTHPQCKSLVRIDESCQGDTDWTSKELFLFQDHGYFSFKGISLPIALVEAIPVEPNDALDGSYVDKKVNAPKRVPTAKRPTQQVVDSKIKNKLAEVPPRTELWRIRMNNRARAEQHTIRETEIFIMPTSTSFNLEDEDVIMVEEEGDDDDDEEDDDDKTKDMTRFEEEQSYLQQQEQYQQQQNQFQEQQLPSVTTDDQNMQHLNHSGLMQLLSNSSNNSSLASLNSHASQHSISPKNDEMHRV